MITEGQLQEICDHYGVHFANRSYGMATTKTVTMDALFKIANEIERITKENVNLNKPPLPDDKPIGNTFYQG